jgi:drug/metabolite transporter (DMT)-like permease
MTTAVFLAVLGAAILHALWNTLVKGGVDKSLNMTALVLGNIPIAIIVLPMVPMPSIESWPYLAAGIGLQICYQFFLLASYRAGDLTQVYPIARGSAPLLVAGVSVLFLGVHLSSIELIAIVTIAAGIISISFVRQQDGSRNVGAAKLALLTGCFIAAYSIVDGLGARLAGTALGYYSWVAIGNAVVFASLMELKNPGLVRSIPQKAKGVFLIGGSASFIAYAIVIWAFTLAPIALVTALREPSIIFALFFGVLVLKEKLDIIKVFSVMMTLLGAAMLKLSKH